MAYDNLVQWKIDLYTYLYVFVYVYSFVHTVTKSQFFWFTLELLVKNFFPHFELYFDTFRSKSIQKEEMKFSRLQLAINKKLSRRRKEIYYPGRSYSYIISTSYSLYHGEKLVKKNNLLIYERNASSINYEEEWSSNRGGILARESLLISKQLE